MAGTITGSARLRRAFALHPERNVQIAIAIAAVALFVAPVLAVVLTAFRESLQGGWTIQPFLEVMAAERTWRITGETILLTVAVIVPSTVLASICAIIVTRTNAWARWLISATMAVAVATPPLFYAVSWGLLGNKTVGLLNLMLRFGEPGNGPVDIESWFGLVFVTTFRTTAFMYLLLIGPFATMDRSLEEAARVSGAGPVRAFLGTQLPVLFPALSGVVILSAIATMEAFDVPMILGVPAGIYVLPTEVYSYLNTTGAPQYAHAGSISLILLALLVALMWLQYRIQGRRRYTTVGGKGARTGVWDLGWWRIPVLVFTVLLALVAVGLPTLQLVLGSLSPYFGATGVYRLDNFAEVLADASIMRSFGTTFVVAAVGAAAAVIVTIVFMWAARLRRSRLGAFIDVSQVLSMAAPGLLLGLGVLTLVLLTPGLARLYGSNALLVFALFVAVVPLASRSVAGALAQIPHDLEEAVRASGGGRFRALLAVVLRLVLPSALNGWLLCFVVLSGSLALPLLLSDRSSTLLAVKVYDYYSTGQVQMAAAIFVLLVIEILVVAGIVAAVRRALAHPLRRRSNRAAASAAPGLAFAPAPRPADPTATASISAVRPRG